MGRSQAIVLLILIGGLALPAAAQNFTNVTGTITDPNGLAYSNAQITANLVQVNPLPTINGNAIQGSFTTSADVTGHFSMTLANNSVVGGAWQFGVTITVAPPIGTGSQSLSAIVVIGGASQDISANLNPLAPPLAHGSGNGTVSGQANGVIPLGTTANSITQQSHIDDGVTTAGTVTSTEPISTPKVQLNSTCNAGTAGCVSLNQGSAPTSLDANSIIEHAPAAVTAYHEIKPGSAATGILHGVADTDGNGLSRLTDSLAPVSLTTDVSGVLPTANGGTNSSEGAVYSMSDQFYFFGGAPASATTYDLGPNTPLLSAFDARQQVLMPSAGTVTALYVNVGVRGTLGVRSGGNDTVTLFKNGSACASGPVINNTTMFTTAGPTPFNDTAHACAFAAGDILEIQLVTATLSTLPTTVDLLVTLKVTAAN